jgi:hypothetical protein
MKDGQFSAAVTAVKEKSILSGHRIERQEVGPAGAFDALTDEELERALIERINALGLRSNVDEKAGADQPAPDAGSDTRH